MTPAHTPATQSVLQPASEGAQVIDDLTLALLVGGAIVFVGVMVLLIRSAGSGAALVNARRWLIGGGLVLPLAVLAVLLVQGLRVGAGLSHDPELKTMEIEVVARRWWWEVRYRAPDGEGWVVLANELHLPLDCAATLKLVSGDVIHSFWVPALAGKVDVIPGRRNLLAVHATREGRYRGQCAEYCGTQHANMALEVVVESPTKFREWLLNQVRPAVEPTDAFAREGQQQFMAAGCATCHAIRGTDAAGVLGPDLTHVASRRLLAAATLGNDERSLADWTRRAQHLKPGNLMPSMPVDDAALRAISAYLAGLH